VKRVTLKNLAAHKRRLFSTFFAVLLGVAFLAGTLTLTNTIGRTFDNLFADVNKGVDAWVRQESEISTGQFTTRGRVDVELLGTVEDVDGVAAAEPQIQGYGQIVGADGEAIGDPGMGAPTFAGNWSEVAELNPYHLVDGRAPRTDNEVVIDRFASKEGKLHVGSKSTVITQGGPIPVTIVGIAKFGDADSTLGATFAGFTLEGAEKYVAEPGKVDAIAAVAEDGVSQEELRKRIQAALPDGVEVITGAALTKENQDDVGSFLIFFTIFFGIFAGIAVVVAVFSIYNTFSIIVAQRTREMALLRAIGAGRGQVLGSVMIEAFIVGVLASALGFVAGFGVAGFLKVVLAAFGVDIPAGGLVVKPSTVVWSFVVGIGVTLVAAIIPARKASKVPPIAALRDVALERTKASVARIVIGAVLTVLGVASVLNAVLSKPDNGVAAAGIGALLTIIGTVVLGPAVARPVSRMLGAPLPRLRGITGSLARENASRNPRRTAGTASALMIGVAVVALFTVVAASIKASFAEALDRSFAGDLFVQSGSFGGGGFDPTMAARLNDLDEVAAASGVRFGAMKVNGEAKDVQIIDPVTFPEVFDADVKAGAFDDLGEHEVAVSKHTADQHGWRVGTALPVEFANGKKDQFTIAALYERRELLGDYALGLPAWEPNATDHFDAFVIVKLADGVTIEQGKRAVQTVSDDYATAKVQDRDEFAESQASQVNQILALVLVMLALAIVISLLGIANTLSLSIFERRRELGLLRAVGTQRRQVRSIVRWESVLVALFGSVGGLMIGVFFGWALVTAASEQGFTAFALPVGWVVGLLVAGAGAGVLAAIFPARRAARLDVLLAIASE